MYYSIRIFALTALTLTLMLPATLLHAQSVESEINAMATQLEEARSLDLHLIAPRTFGQAEERLVNARSRYAAGGNITEIRKLLQESQSNLQEALEVQEVGRVILRDALDARNDAVTAGSNTLAKTEWKDAEDAMHDAGRDIEKGDQNDARQDAQKAVRAYRAAELTAIRTRLLGDARTRREQAREADAEKFARQTWQSAGQSMQEAERILANDRYAHSEAQQMAQAATEQYEHASTIAGNARYVDDDVERRFEEVVLRYEGQIAQIADALNLEAQFSEGSQPVTEQAIASITSLQQDYLTMQRTLDERQQAIEELSTRLASLQQRDETVTGQLEQRRQREAALQRIRSFFTNAEADVLLRGEELTIRLIGLKFDVGSSTIQPQYFPVLTKLQRALQEFPDAPVNVTGHTDSQGASASNQQLSEQRADAVRSYLLANMTTLSPTRIRAIGYGASQPIASNENEAGRQQNRRIDVQINLAEAPTRLSGRE